MNDHWTFADCAPPAGCEWACDTHETIVSCHIPRVKVVEEAAPEVEAEVAPIAEGEVKEAA